METQQTATLRELHRHMAFIFTEARNPTLFSMTVWALWNRRNNLRLGKATISLSQLLDQAKDRLLEFFQHLNPAPPSTVRTDSCWRPPDSSSFKINFDGALFSQEKRAGIGVVIRNEAGLVMAPLTQQIPLPSSVLEVETLAARGALELAIEIGVNRVILEGGLCNSHQRSPTQQPLSRGIRPNGPMWTE